MPGLETAVIETTANELRPIRVLLVEDEFFISEWVAESLSDQGFVVRAVTNAADALRLLKSWAVDVLFTDINLPGGVDGTALARQAREMLPDLPVVYASGRVNNLDSRLRVSGSLFVAKPYVPETGRPAACQCSAGRRARRTGLKAAALLFERAAGEKFFQPVDVIVAIDDRRFLRECAEQRQCRFNSIDHELIERAL